MRQAVAAAVLVSQLAGCFTYALNVEEPSGEVVGIMASADVVVGLGVGIGMTLSDRSLGSVGEDLLAGVGGVFLLDLLIGLGINVGDFTNSGTEPAHARPRMLRLGGSF